MEATSLCLPSVTDYNDHILVLKGFHAWFSTLDGLTTEEREDCFIGAIHDFFSWAASKPVNSQGTMDEKSLPDVGVLAVLYSYMLHPREFHEDTQRALHGLKEITRFPLKELASQLRSKTCNGPGLAKEDKLLCIPSSLNCPICTVVVDQPEASRLCLCTDTAVECQRCHHFVTRDGLRVHRLLSDIISFQEGGPPIAGSMLRIDTGEVDAIASRKISRDVANLVFPDQRRPAPPPTYNEMLKVLTDSCHAEHWEARALAIWDAYSHPFPSSIDLYQSLCHQRICINVYDREGLLEPPTAELYEKKLFLYKGFLRRSGMANAIGPQVPDDETDLVWHTHQLNAQQYRTDMLALTGQIINHIPGWQVRDQESRLPVMLTSLCHVVDILTYQITAPGEDLCKDCKSSPCRCNQKSCHCMGFNPQNKATGNSCILCGSPSMCMCGQVISGVSV